MYKDNEKANLDYEILFLFNCSICGHFKMEMEKLYSDNLDEVEQIIDKKYVPKNIIEKIEKIEKKEKCSTNKKYYYFQYNRKNPVFKNYYKSRKNNIPEEVKQIVLQKLFQFYVFKILSLIIIFSFTTPKFVDCNCFLKCILIFSNLLNFYFKLKG
jgi:hypothetical protein